MELNAPPKEMALAPIHTIVSNLDRVFGKGKWHNYEIETMSMELGFVFDDLTQDKLNMLQIVCQLPEAYYEDVLFYLHSVNVINNNIASFETFPMPTSLEVALAHVEMKKIFGDRKYGKDIIKTVQYILTLEGYSEAIWPFNEMGITTNELAQGQHPEDTKNKEEAVKRYIEGMESDDHRNHS